jgi:hypothetical protein
VFLQTFIAEAALRSTTMLRPKATARKTPTWPTPTPEQVEVVLLGTYHMDNPGNDAANVTADDVLDEGRQREIERLVSELERADPDSVVVERPASATAAIADTYDRYRTGKFDYDQERTVDVERDGEPDGELSARDETVQVGFRLADRLGHERVVPVDVPEDLSDDPAFQAFATGEGVPEPKQDVPRFDDEALEASMDERLAESTVTGYHRFLNEEAALHYNEGMFDDLLRFGGEGYAGPDALARWYRRNLRMAHNVWQALDDDTERVLCLVGSGHVHVLRHLFTEFPQFCPVSPLPYLPRDG